MPLTIPIDTPGQLLSGYRNRAGLTQEELAQKIDASPISISNIENDKQCPSAKLWADMVQTLGIPHRDAVLVWCVEVTT